MREPAVVIGAGGPCGLGVVRSLHQANIPVTICDPDPSAPAMHTRLASKVVISALSGSRLIEDLLSLSRRIGSPAILFPTCDEAVLTISEYRAELHKSYRLRLPSHASIVKLMHKASFQQLAEALGFPVPRAARLTREAGFEALARFPFPAIIKPSFKTREYIKEKLARAYKVNSREEAEIVSRRILAIVDEVVVQQWVEGDDSDLYFCLQYRGENSSEICSFTGRKISIWPPETGLTASCTAAPAAHAALHPLTTTFFRSLSFVGMGGMEFKRDARTGQFFLIEPTVGRVDAQEEVATLHGINIPLAAYRYETTGQFSAAGSACVAVVWRDYAAHRRSGRRRDSALVPSRRTYDAYWRLDDPVPAVLHYSLGLGRSLRRRLRRSP